jgi:hypothetical protein
MLWIVPPFLSGSFALRQASKKNPGQQLLLLTG